MEDFHVAILGAGPAGLGAATNAAHHSLSHVLIEKAEIGNTIFEYQLRKHVMAEPKKLPLRARVGFDAGSREAILEEWNRAVTEGGVNVRKAEVTKIQKNPDGKFEIHYAGGSCTAKYVVLSIGIQGSPRKLGVPGDDQPHVAYTLRDPDAFQDKDILIVGAGDAAIENALALCEKNRVSLLNRSDEFSRAKDANVALILGAIAAGKVRCYYNSSVAKVEPEHVVLETPDGETRIPCNQIIARLGAIMPRKFIEACGIKFPNDHPASVPVVNHRYECNVEGLFVLGSLIGYPLIKHGINQGYEVIEHIIGNPVEPSDQVQIVEALEQLEGDPNENLRMIRDALPLFNELSDPQFRELVIDSVVHSKPADEVIFHRNDYTDSFYSVVKGSVLIELPNGKAIRKEPGDFFGEMGLLSGRRRSATVRMGESGILLETPRKQILKLIAAVEAVKRQIDERFMLNALQTKIFPDVPSEFIVKLTAKARLKNFKKGEILFREGDIGDFLYVIRKGSVKVARRDTEGEDVAQTYIPAGNFVGEMAILTAEPLPRTATVIAAVPCETIVIEKQDLLDLLEANPEAKRRIHQMAQERRIENIVRDQDTYAGEMLDFIVSEGITDAENVLIIDSDLCVACDNCESACAATHGGYSRLDRKGGKSFAAIQIPVSCRHCENPLCMLDCPPDALTRLPDGEVVIRDSCIGCGNCVRNCPYGVIQMVYDKPQSSGYSFFNKLFGAAKKAEKGAAKAGKCDMCSSLDGGPACVRACPTGAAMRVNPSKLLTILSDKGTDHIGAGNVL